MALLPDKEKLLRNFLRCANWEEKYLYIIELGQRLPELRDEDKSPQNSILLSQQTVNTLQAGHETIHFFMGVIHGQRRPTHRRDVVIGH